MLALLAAITFLARQGGWLPDETGSFTAVDGDSLRKDGKDYRLHAIDAPELFQTCWREDGREYPCGHAARDELRRLIRNATVTCQVLDTDRTRPWCAPAGPSPIPAAARTMPPHRTRHAAPSVDCGRAVSSSPRPGAMPTAAA